MSSNFLNPYDSKTYLPLVNYSDNVIEKEIFQNSSSLLSSVYIQSITGSVLVQFYDRTSGIDSGEAVLLSSHPLLTSPITSKITVSKIHNKPFMRITIIGTALFGIYITAIPSVSIINATDISSGGGGSSSTKDQLLSASDLNKDYTFEDFGTKTERVTQIIYSSLSLSLSLQRNFSYTLIGTKYKLINEIWS